MYMLIWIYNLKIFTLNYSCTINAPCADVCQFHTDTNNLPLITPPWIDTQILQMDTPMREGSVVVLKIKRFNISTIWKMQIQKQQCPHTVVDMMLSGPFKHFRHEMIFNQIDESQTKMDEAITIVLPIWYIGALIFPLIKLDMDKIFAFRHEATKRLLDKRRSEESFV
jgi:ligand-binding SRPBCC domain-containing protein